MGYENYISLLLRFDAEMSLAPSAFSIFRIKTFQRTFASQYSEISISSIVTVNFYVVQENIFYAGWSQAVNLYFPITLCSLQWFSG
jgi:hypothetical protein